MNIDQIRFPHLHIVLNYVPSGFSIFGFEIKFYGIVIALGFMLGLLIAQQEAKRTGQDPELYLDYLLVMTVPAIIGARLYYVIFSWNYYKAHPGEIFSIRNGGLAIYGGVLVGILVMVIFAKIRKQKILLMADTLIMGLLFGQILGRWGNFFNREAFGGFTDSILAMQIPVDYFHFTTVADLQASGVFDHLVTIGQQKFIQVHPTFLYEGMWNLAVLLFVLLFFRYRKTADGQMFAIYLMGYGAGRFLIEGLRSDSLYFMNTSIRVSQMLAAILVALGLALFVAVSRKARSGQQE